MKRAFCPNAKLPMPKWPRLREDFSEKDAAEARMVNSLHIDPPKRLLQRSLRMSVKILQKQGSPQDGRLVHQYTFKTGVYTSQMFLTWSRLVEALDLAFFDEDMVTLLSTADAWKPLPAIVHLWILNNSFADIEI